MLNQSLKSQSDLSLYIDHGKVSIYTLQFPRRADCSFVTIIIWSFIWTCWNKPQWHCSWVLSAVTNWTTAKTSVNLQTCADTDIQSTSNCPC